MLDANTALGRFALVARPPRAPFSPRHRRMEPLLRPISAICDNQSRSSGLRTQLQPVFGPPPTHRRLPAIGRVTGKIGACGRSAQPVIPPAGENVRVDLGRFAWLATVLACLIAVLILLLQGYYGYALVTFAVAVSAALNLG